MCSLIPLIAQTTAPSTQPTTAPATAPTTLPVTPEETIKEVVERLGVRQTFTESDWVDWLVLLGALFLGVALGRLVQLGLRRLADRLDKRNWKTRATAFRAAAGPAQLIFFAIGLKLGLMPLVLSPPVRLFADRSVEFLLSVAIGWYFYNLVDVAAAILERYTRRTKSTLDDQLVPLVSKTLRLFLVVVFALFIAENVFGANITAWLAGLGIAGLAVSLAAQDSIKNLFGSLTVLLDRPYGVGDGINYDGQEGNVETIGFRSTKLRTADGELVTIPNSKIVDNSVRNIGRRPYIRRVMELGIAADTPPEQMERAVEIVKGILTDPEIARAFDMERNPPRVSFESMSTQAFNLKVFYWHTPPKYWDYLEHAQRVNLRILRAFAEAGISLALPSRTVFLADDPTRGLSVRMERTAAENVPADDNGSGRH
jgi:MscS family membrane protein